MGNFFSLHMSSRVYWCRVANKVAGERFEGRRCGVVQPGMLFCISWLQAVVISSPVAFLTSYQSPHHDL